MSTARRVLVLLAAALAICAGGALAHEKKCDLSDGSPVCGANGIEYTNKCIAKLQNVTIAKKGRCDDIQVLPVVGEETPDGQPPEEESSPIEESPVEDPGVYISRKLRETEGEVTLTDITAFDSAGYGFVGVFKSEDALPPQELPMTPQDAGLLLTDTPAPAPSPSPAPLPDTPVVSAMAVEVGATPTLTFNATDGEANTTIPLNTTLDVNTTATDLSFLLTSDAWSGTVQAEFAFDRRGRSDVPRGAFLSRTGRHYVQSRYSVRRAPTRRWAPRRPSRKSRMLLTVPGIVGEDGRKTSPLNEFPFTAVTALVFEGKKSHTVCTASFIAPDVLITTASCLYDVDNQAYYDLAPATLYDVYGKKLKAAIDGVVVTTQYILGDLTYDVGLIILENGTDYSGSLGFLGRGVSCDLVEGSEAKVLGYPVDKKGRAQYKSACPLTSLCSHRIVAHECEVTPGMSGGPLLTPDDGVIRGVALGTLGPDANSAVLLDDDINAFIDDVIANLHPMAPA